MVEADGGAGAGGKKERVVWMELESVDRGGARIDDVFGPLDVDDFWTKFAPPIGSGSVGACERGC